MEIGAREIVFIGAEMDEVAIRRRLNAWLVGDANAREMKLTVWKGCRTRFRSGNALVCLGGEVTSPC